MFFSFFNARAQSLTVNKGDAINVNPAPQIIAGVITGSISACAGTASVSPNIQHFSVSGANLTNNITATAPAGFEISFAANTGYSTILTLIHTAGIVNNKDIYVRSSSSAAVGTLAGKVVLTSTGVPDQQVSVSGIVNQLPKVNAVNNQVVVNGEATTDINFTGTGNAYSWVNNTPGIGLAASGTGNIPSFTAINNTSSPITARITVKPLASGYAYVANYGSNSVTVISTKTKTVVTTIPVGNNPFGVSASIDGGLVYVTNKGSNTVSVISTATNTVINTINVGRAPQGVVVSPDGARLYVANSMDNTVSVINTLTNVIVKNVGVGKAPYGITISADGENIYVANFDSSNVSIIKASTNTVATTVAVGFNPTGISVIPDGSLVYVSSAYNVTAINTVANNTTSTISLSQGIGMAPSPDGTKVYVATLDGYYSIIYVGTNISSSEAGYSRGSGISITADGKDIYWVSSLNNTISITNSDFTTATIVPVGSNPYSIGNFISKGTNCDGSPITFTITVNPTPKIKATAVTGNIVACAGSASVSPDIGQLTISGNNLSADIMATAPSGFEISLNATSGYGNNISLTPVAGVVNNTIVYVRSAASAPAGSLKGKITLTSAGAQNYEVDVTGTIQQLPTVTNVNNQLVLSGNRTSNVIFSGTADSYSWSVTGDDIGLPLNGTGNFPSFLVSNNTPAAKVAIVTVTPLTNAAGGKGCDGVPVSFTITVNPLPIITASAGSLFMNTTYGTPSAATGFKVSATNLIESILLTPPLGFELSADNINFANTITIPAVTGSVTNFAVYLRLASTSNAGNYSGNIILSSNGAANLNIPVSNSLVTPADITLTADNKNKTYGSTLNNTSSGTSFTITGGSLKNGNTITSVNLTYGTGAAGTDPVGSYNTISIMLNTGGNGFLGSNYSINYVRGNINVLPAPLNIVANNITKTYGATLSNTSNSNEFNLTGIQNQETIGGVTLTYGNGSAAIDPPGIYQASIIPSLPTGGSFNAGNYSITYTAGSITVSPPIGINVSGALASVATIYGSPSSTTAIEVSGTNLPAGILVTPPAGFEVSLDNVRFFASVTIGNSGNIAAIRVYFRLAKITPVGSYSGNIVLSSSGLNNLNRFMPLSTVSPAPLMITADNKTKVVNSDNPILTVTYLGFVNNESPNQLTTRPTVTTDATKTSAVGQYSITASGAVAANYTISYLPGVLTVNPAPLAVTVPNVFTPNGDGINDYWTITGLDLSKRIVVSVFNRWGSRVFYSNGYSELWDGTYKGTPLPASTYYYVINTGNKSELLSGSITILR
ncbi:hypothetical protein GCM10023149_12880 [Mucilaginibacter gynuensis]|uniref:Gliding motility-associated-like protein n=1 Tax=Mucilaginibacter gynuensis TaxID=1302236 RepID=A0ABP8G2G5_9SPHI